MNVDANSDSGWHCEPADICIIGAGPAGLVLASELAGHGSSVTVLESGGTQRERFYQQLNEGDGSDEYGDIQSTRCRQIGGTANLWNTEVDGMSAAKFLPLDPVDFVPRRGRPEGWPFGREALHPYYLRAQAIAELGPFLYQGSDWSQPDRAPLAQESELLASAIYRFGAARPYTSVLAQSLAAADHVRLVTHATVLELETDRAATRITAAKVGLASGKTVSVRARQFVLAAGAIESARLLLASPAPGGGGIGNASGWVGRGFMEHPRDHALTLTPRRSAIEELGFYDLHRGADGTWIMGRLAFEEAALRDHDLPNASVSLLAAYRRGFAAPWLERGRRLVGLPPAYPRGGAGWWNNPERPERFNVLVNLEQAPREANRVRLSTRRDALGMPRVQLVWKWTRAEQRALERLRGLVRDEFERLGLGQVTLNERALPSPRAHHHAGTLRMHEDPRHGVVDVNGRVHDVENLYCAGAAVFPTAGFANPMLTVLALAIRLADHLSGPLPRRYAEPTATRPPPEWAGTP